MLSSAFVSSTPCVLKTTWTRSTTSITRANNSNSLRISLRRVRCNNNNNNNTINMNNEEEIKTTTTKTEKIEDNNNDDIGGFKAPTLNTTAFSDFIEQLQLKANELQERIENIDSDKLIGDTIDSSKGLIDNFLAGDWLNRGELYGTLQIILVILLFRPLYSIDILVSLFTGPLLIILGSTISSKALWDLGFSNLSIWPAPVPNGCLKTDGIYSYIRHPIYSGILIATIGYSVAMGSPAKIAVATALAALIVKKINIEEEFLCEAYPDYDEYKENVPYKLIPKLY